MGARFYDPSTRRFTGPDPVFLGFDRYAYASNDPVNRTDPDGRCDELSYWFCDWPGYGGFGTWFQSWDSEGPPASSGPIGSNGGGGVILSPGAGPGHAHNVIENRVDSTTDYLWDAARSTTDCKNSNCHVYDRSKHHASLNWERFKPLTAGEMVNFLVTGFGEALFGGSAANAPSTEDVLLGRVENSLSEEEQIWNSTKFWAVWYLPVGSMVRYAGRLSFAEAPSVFLYRTMSREQLDLLLDSGALAGGKENFLSMNAFYSQALYRGAVVEFRLAPEALDELATMGVRNNARLTQLQFGELSLVSKGWTQSSVFFKAEGPLVNIGVGQGAGLEAFNNLIRGIRVIEP